MEISLHSPSQVILDGASVTAFESAKVRALLAYLAAESARLHNRESLAALRAAIGEQAFTAAFAKGQAMALGQAMEEALAFCRQDAVETN